MEVKLLSILVPAYNEEKTIRIVLDKLVGLPLINGIEKEIIVIDDCSADNTAKEVTSFIASCPGASIKYFRQEHNEGKGAALHRGIKEASGDYIVVQDADLEYNPEEFNLLLAELLKGDCDVVYGSRFLGAKEHKERFMFHTFGNKTLTNFSNLFTGLKLTDMETCYKLMPTKALQSLTLTEKRFGFEPEVTAKLANLKLRFKEVPISYFGRNYEEGKKIGWKDGVRAIYCILKFH